MIQVSPLVSVMLAEDGNELGTHVVVRVTEDKEGTPFSVEPTHLTDSATAVQLRVSKKTALKLGVALIKLGEHVIE